MALNKKVPKSVRIYVIVSQYVIYMAFLTFIGYFLGNKLDIAREIDGAFYSAIFGVIGIVIGVVTLIYNVMRLKDER